MGLLSEGSPLSWEETKDLADHVRRHGIKQFINLYHRLKNRQGDVLKWGDEVRLLAHSEVVLKVLPVKSYQPHQSAYSFYHPLRKSALAMDANPKSTSIVQRH